MRYKGYLRGVKVINVTEADIFLTDHRLRKKPLNSSGLPPPY